MRILFVGESWQGSSARSLREALQNRPGHVVADLAEDAFSPKYVSLFMRGMNRLLGPLQRRELHLAIIRSVRAFHPDLVLVYKGASVKGGTIQALRDQGISTINVYPDYSPHAYGMRLQKAIGLYNLVISTKPFHPGLWAEQYGYTNSCVCVPHGYDPAVHLWENPPESSDLDVALCANWRPEYHRLMMGFAQGLPENTSISVAIAGSGWMPHIHDLPSHWTYPGSLTGRAYGEFLRRARIVLAPVNSVVVIKGQLQHGDEDTTRTYELAAAHCFFLHQRTPFVETLYDEHTEVPLWSDASEMAHLVMDWLPRDVERRKMAHQAHRRAVPLYSIPTRADEIIVHMARLVEEREKGEL